MDESALKERAQKHGDAIVAGDIAKAVADLTPEARAKGPAVMGALPSPLEAADVVSIEPAGDSHVVTIRYAGASESTEVVSTWKDVEGTHMVVDLEVR